MSPHDASDLAAELTRRGVSGVDDSTLARALYSADASLHRVLPQVVARPAHVDELPVILDAATVLGVPVTMRGAGTSIAGNAIGPGIVVDTRDLARFTIDPDSRTAQVEPGVVHARLQKAAAAHGLRFGPDPSTHTRCTIGGMIGNNACGSRALGYGRTSDNVERLDVLFGTGERAVLDASYDGPAGAALTGLAAEHLAHIRTGFGRFSRQVSGYSLEHLLPEQQRLDRFLVGSEGTLGIVLGARVRLVPDEPVRHLLVLGYPTMPEAADAVPAILAAGEGRLVACEGLDAAIVDLARRRSAVPELPRGEGYLYVEAAGADASDVLTRVAAAAGALDQRVITDRAAQAALWRVREDGAGLAAVSLDSPAYSGWEDAAVPPENLGAWLRDFDSLLADHGLRGLPYGHFGDGCVHARIDFPLRDPGGVELFGDFMRACAERLADYGGSLSGEHGDGRARSSLLPLMYDDTSLSLFGRVKAICDPDNLLNPGVLVDPDPFDEDLRAPRPRQEPALGLRMEPLTDQAHRCTGVGKCVAPDPRGVMCPSYLATGQEKDSTRGRARVLQEALDGSLVDGLTDPAVTEALDLCLACKGCASDCPTGVDVATWKSEVLHQVHDVAGVRRPRTHRTLGALPRWLRLARPVAPLVNAAIRVPFLARVAKASAGIDPQRGLPALGRGRLPVGDSDPEVWVWADSITAGMTPQAVHAAVRVLRSAGLRVGVVGPQACCGLTWVATGQLDQARARMRAAVDDLHPLVAAGTPVVGLEPSCTATMREDAVRLLDDPRAAEVAAGVRTLAEVLTERLEAGAWSPPDLTGETVVAQPHCHHASVLGWAADEALLKAAGAEVRKVDGCCGLAGAFGMEAGHYEVSVAVAETSLLPAVRDLVDGVVLADGFSCRHQLADLADVRALHLAELFDPGEPQRYSTRG
ncbi:FAD-binding and (Fe-S)-binding domain-containing protein [Nocardioides limicola]|uniref:FAD-binding and (Fe-S)-binding domain-containing protein n=1 Tax=Nocardioides limicola TaxID=2803368 RepID=UPI00193C78DD|nr:FAD-binding and (Fe-S)-binding domain-containing protein [Nocardioides sp. DJM-14]